MVKNWPLGDTRDVDLIPGLGRSPGVGNGNPLSYSCLGNFMDRSLVGYSPWGCKESDKTEYIHVPTYIHITFSTVYLFFFPIEFPYHSPVLLFWGGGRRWPGVCFAYCHSPRAQKRSWYMVEAQYILIEK